MAITLASGVFAEVPVALLSMLHRRRFKAINAMPAPLLQGNLSLPSCSGQELVHGMFQRWPVADTPFHLLKGTVWSEKKLRTDPYFQEFINQGSVNGGF